MVVNSVHFSVLVVNLLEKKNIVCINIAKLYVFSFLWQLDGCVRQLILEVGKDNANCGTNVRNDVVSVGQLPSCRQPL